MTRSIAVAVLALVLPGPASAQEEEAEEQEEEADVEAPAKEETHIPKTREERREAGLKLELTDWLTLSGGTELEYSYQRYRLMDASTDSADDFSGTLQAGLEATPVSWATLEVIYEYDGEHTIDEATAALTAGDFELELGLFNVSFGEYFSHFITGPVLELGETRGSAAALSYGPDDRLDLSVFLYDGQTDGPGSSGGSLDGGLAMEGSPFESATVGVSFLTDLTDSQIYGESVEQRRSRVPGWNAYAALDFGWLETTGEIVGALGSLDERSPDLDAPLAWNVEVAFYPKGDFEGALRLEGSSEVEGEPHYRGGAALAWRITDYASLRLEYLRGTFHHGSAEDLTGQESDSVQQVGVQLSIE